MTQPANNHRPHQVSLQSEWQAFWLAVGFLTRGPMLVRIDYSPSLMYRSSVYFPLVGLVSGVLSCKPIMNSMV